MPEFKLPEINNGIKITQEEWDKFQKDLRDARFKLQEINDNLEGGLTSRNLASFRNTYVINAQDSLDDSYPMYVHFNILDEMVKIVSVKVDFWILNYRAYSTAAKSGGGSTPTSSEGGSATPTSSEGGSATPTSSEGGSATPTSSSTGAASGGSGTTGLYGGTYANFGKSSGAIYHDPPGGYLITEWEYGLTGDHSHTTPVHSHPGHQHTVTIANHTHTVTIANHTHTVTIANHTHTVTIDAHTHDITYGIHEEETSPTIKFYVSENAGTSYSDVYGGYDTDKSGIDITSWLTKVGSKLIRFTSDVRARLSVQIEIKLDIKAR